jgi:hypothetical protein
LFSPTELIDADKAQALLVERLANLPAGTKAFVTLPIGPLSSTSSICDALRSGGAEVKAIS